MSRGRIRIIACGISGKRGFGTEVSCFDSFFRVGARDLLRSLVLLYVLDVRRGRSASEDIVALYCFLCDLPGLLHLSLLTCSLLALVLLVSFV